MQRQLSPVPGRRGTKPAAIAALIMTGAFVVRVAVSGTSVAETVVFLVVGIGTCAVILVVDRRLIGNATRRSTDQRICISGSVNAHWVRELSVIDPPKPAARFSWVFGGWLGGEITIDEVGITWQPGWSARRIARAGRFRCEWASIQDAAIDGPYPIRSRGTLTLTFTDKTQLMFMIGQATPAESALVRFPPSPSEG